MSANEEDYSTVYYYPSTSCHYTSHTHSRGREKNQLLKQPHLAIPGGKHLAESTFKGAEGRSGFRCSSPAVHHHLVPAAEGRG